MMSGENILTDQLNLVQREKVKGFLKLFSRQRSVSDGFCLVIFRKEEYRGSILSDDIITEGDLKRRSERLGIRDGDSILRVNLGPRPLSISERLSTLDGYTRFYTLELEIAVNDPRSFAQRYLQDSDPVKLARIAIEGYLQRYAVRKRHDDLREDMLRDYAEQALTEGSNRSFGLGVIAAHKVILSMDQTRIKELEIQQQGRLKEREIREESRLKQIEAEEETNIRKAGVFRDAEVKNLETQFELKEDERLKRYDMYMIEESTTHRHSEELKEDEHQAKRKIFQIQDDSKQRELTRICENQELAHLRTQALLKAAGEKSIDPLSDVISQQIEDQRLLQPHVELKDVFLIPGKISKNDAEQSTTRIDDITDPHSQKNDEKSSGSASGTSSLVPAERNAAKQSIAPVTGTLPGILRQQNDTINITDLGMPLIQTKLSATQYAIASTATPTAFLISALDEYGPASKAQLATGDLVVEINGEEPRDVQSIARILRSYKPSSAVSLCILRGNELINVDL